MTPSSFVITENFAVAVRRYFDHLSLLLTFPLIAAFFPIISIFLDASESSAGNPFSLMLTPVTFGIYVLCQLALIRAVQQVALGEEISFRDLILEASARIWRGIGGYLLFLLILLTGTLLLVLPALYWFTIFYFFVFIIALEDLSLWGAFQRSHGLVRGSFWKVAGAHASVFLVTLLIILPIMVGMKILLVPAMAQQLVSLLMGTLLMPLMICFYYQLYDHLRREVDGEIKIVTQETA